MATKLNPLRDVSQHDIIPFFSLAENSGDVGQFVTIQGSGFKSSDRLATQDLYTVANTVNWRWSVPHKVRLSTSGEGKGEILGILYTNVRETNYLGVPMIYDKTRSAEQNSVPSGQAVNVAVRGYFLVSGVATGAGNTIQPMSGAQANDSVNGDWKLVGRNDANSVGSFLGASDNNGYALFFLNL